MSAGNCPRNVSGLHNVVEGSTPPACLCGERHPGYQLPRGWSWSERELERLRQVADAWRRR